MALSSGTRYEILYTVSRQYGLQQANSKAATQALRHCPHSHLVFQLHVAASSTAVIQHGEKLERLPSCCQPPDKHGEWLIQAGMPLSLSSPEVRGAVLLCTTKCRSLHHVKSGMQSPADLHGRKVGVRSYTLTPGVWARGILQSAYGVDLEHVQWVIFGDDEHVQEYIAPSHEDLFPRSVHALG